jgi:hypothetical protein
MNITRISSYSGKVYTFDINVTEEQIKRWRSGELIQNVMPELTAWEREFLITGMTQDEWDEMSKEEE